MTKRVSTRDTTNSKQSRQPRDASGKQAQVVQRNFQPQFRHGVLKHVGRSNST